MRFGWKFHIRRLPCKKAKALLSENLGLNDYGV